MMSFKEFQNQFPHRAFFRKTIVQVPLHVSRSTDTSISFRVSIEVVGFVRYLRSSIGNFIWFRNDVFLCF